MVFVTVFVGNHAVYDLYATHRANSARRAFAAGFNRTELHGKARLLRHVDCIVEYDNPAVPEHCANIEEGLVIEWRIELVFRNIGAERPADREAKPAAQYFTPD